MARPLGIIGLDSDGKPLVDKYNNVILFPDTLVATLRGADTFKRLVRASKVTKKEKESITVYHIMKSSHEDVTGLPNELLKKFVRPQTPKQEIS